MTIMRAGVRVRSAVAAVVVGVLAVAAGGTAASAAPPDVDAVIELMPGIEDADAVQITDDAVYFVSYVDPDAPYGDPVGTLYRRSLTATAGGHALGAPEVIGRIVPESSFAVHDGTVAYLRAVDGRVVLRAPDGAETTPAWGASPMVAAGVRALSGGWAVVNDYPYDPVYTLVNLLTGATYDLGDLVAMPADYTWLADSWTVDVTDDRLLFGQYSQRGVGTDDVWFYGVYTVGLDSDGPVGAPTVLQEVDNLTGTGGWVLPIGFDGTRALWEENQCDTDDCTTYVHRSDAPYSSTSAVNVGPGNVLGRHAGSTVVLDDPVLDGISHLTWIDVSPAPAPPSPVLDVPGYAGSVHGSFAAYGDAITGEHHLLDATGGTLTGDQTTPAPSVPFTDTRGQDPFTAEILWLYDHGVVGGYSDGTYRPGASVNRDAMAAFLYRLAHDGTDAPACTTAAFADVPASHPFCGEIAWLADTAITTGWADGTFRPATPVTREAMAAFLHRFAHGGADAPACATAPFTDVVVANPFCGDVDWMADAGISTGWPDHTFRPAASIERQAMAAFLFRFIDAGLVPTAD